MTDKAVHYALDLETLSSRNDAAIISIGLVAHTEDDIVGELEVLIDPGLSPGHRDPGTLVWWSTQPIHTFAHAMSGKTAPSDACRRVNEFLASHGGLWMWANAPSFDCVIPRNMFRECGIEFKSSFKHERCYRTVLALARSRPDAAEVIERTYAARTGDAHSALDDARTQARVLMELNKVLPMRIL